jgi:hypothetical protein
LLTDVLRKIHVKFVSQAHSDRAVKQLLAANRGVVEVSQPPHPHDLAPGKFIPVIQIENFTHQEKNSFWLGY